MSALEQSMRDICAKHGLLNIVLTMHSAPTNHLSVSVQWLDDSQERGRGCVFGDGGTFAECLTDALRQMVDMRFPVPPMSELADVVLEVVA